MGVPGFFAWILKNYKSNNILLKQVQEKINILYIDANSLFHPQAFKILDYYIESDKTRNLDINKLESDINSRIIRYIDFLISFVNPEKTFIAVDGVAPMAKISQQRKRRYKTVLDSELKNKIYSKFKIPKYKIPNNIWSNNSITPGTNFMDKLNMDILEYIKNKPNIIYSNYSEPGEGEHKIHQDIKLKSNQNLVIYGLDADLIFLSLISDNNNIYLLREQQVFDKNIPENKNINKISEPLLYVSINQTKLSILDNFYSNIRLQNNKPQNYIYDFVFICYFLGNDFVPNIPSLDIKNKGLDIILSAYYNIYNKLNTNLLSYQNSQIKINHNFFEPFINYLANRENHYFEKILPEYLDYLETKNNNKYNNNNYESELKLELDLLENMDHPDLNLQDPVQLGVGYAEYYKFRYYEYYNHISEYQNKFINNICEDYLTGIIWTTRYYFESAPCQYWSYQYNNSPFVSDLSKYLNSKKPDINNIKFNKKINITPYIQLLAVIPPVHNYLIPEKYKKFQQDPNLLDLFPEKFDLDIINKDLYFKTIPILPFLDIQRILTAINNNNII